MRRSAPSIDAPRPLPTSPCPKHNLGGNPAVDRPAPARPHGAAEPHRAVIERRRLVAGLVVVVLVGLGVVTAVLLLRDGDETAVTCIRPRAHHHDARARADHSHGDHCVAGAYDAIDDDADDDDPIDGRRLQLHPPLRARSSNSVKPANRR